MGTIIDGIHIIIPAFSATSPPRPQQQQRAEVLDVQAQELQPLAIFTSPKNMGKPSENLGKHGKNPRKLGFDRNLTMEKNRGSFWEFMWT